MSVARRGIVALWNGLSEELRSGVPVILWALISLILITTGPFGTYAAFGFLERTLFWLPIMAVMILAVSALHAFLQRKQPELDLRMASLLVTLTACTVLVPMLHFLVSLIAPQGSANHPSYGEILLLVGSLSLGLSALRLAKAQVVAAEPVAVEKAAAPVPPPIRLLQRIDPELRGELLAISVRDHYVDVHTSAGETSLLMRLADAISEADTVAGAQVHRSHWVAWSAVESVEREAGRVFLRLSHGGKVPVSKNHREKLEKRGLL